MMLSQLTFPESERSTKGRHGNKEETAQSALCLDCLASVLLLLESRLGSRSLSRKGCSGRDGHQRGEEGEFIFTFREKLLRWGWRLERGGRGGSGWQGYSTPRLHSRPRRLGGMAASAGQPCWGGGGGGVKSLDVECVVWLRAQDHAADGGRPWVLFVLLKKWHRTKAMTKKFTEIGAGRMMPIASDWMEDEALCNGNGGGNTAMWLDTLGLQSVMASEQCKQLNVPAIMLDVALLARDDDGMSLLLSSCSGLWTVQNFLPSWCRTWEGEEAED
jgi:hypothetical protein